MYKVINEQQVLLALITEPRYVTQSANGTFIQTDEENAKGIVVNSTVYQLIGREKMSRTADTVHLIEVEGGNLILQNSKGVADAQDATCELSETTEDSIAALEQAICDLSEEIFGGGEE